MLLAGCAAQSHRLIKPDPVYRDPVYRETEVRQARPRLNGEVFDPQEFEPALTTQFAMADLKAERAVKDVERDSHFIFHFWDAKKRILAEQYGILWKTPAELNPGIAYANYGQPEITHAENLILRTLTASQWDRGFETMLSVTRSFEGVASVWTRGEHGDQIREYRFVGHDDAWTFLDARNWEE